MILLDKMLGASTLDDFIVNVSHIHDIMDGIAKVVLHDTTQDVKTDIRSVERGAIIYLF